MAFIRLEAADLKLESLEQIQGVWASNHESIVDRIRQEHPPYFALHSAGAVESLALTRTKTAYLSRLITFYDKEQTERRAFQFYDATTAMAARALQHDDIGNVFLFNVEESGRNILDPWERWGGRAHPVLTGDSPQYRAFLESNNEEDQLWRSDIKCTPAWYAKHSRHVIQLHKLPYASLAFEGHEALARTVLTQRLQAQDVLWQVLEKAE